MWHSLTHIAKRWLTPQSTDRDEMFRERTIRGMIVIMAFVMSSLAIQAITINALNRLPQFFATFALIILAQIAVNKGKINVAAWIITLFGVLFFVINVLQVGYWLPGTFIAAVFAIVLGTILLSARNTQIIAFSLVFIYTVGALWTTSRGMVSPLPDGAYSSPLSASVSFVLIILLLSGSLSYLIREFNLRRNELKNLIETLEERVADRTRDLSIAAEVSLKLTTILDVERLLSEIVNQTAQGFDLYHASIFLFNQASNVLSYQAGSGSVGQIMKAENKHFLLTDQQGLVPSAARSRKAVVVNNVATDVAHLKNPHLPNTHSEAVLPMIVGNQLIGVLDLQSEHPDRFKEDDLRVLTLLAEQIGIAVQNAHLYASQVKVADELRAVDSMKSQFLASMSHELRTPLNAILNFTEFVSTGLLGPVNERQHDALDKSLESGKHLLSLINDVLDMTKIEAGMMTLFVEENINLQEELITVIATAQTLVKEKPVTFVEDIDANLPQMTGDRRRIKQILLNLVSNAAKFTEEGSITLSAKNRGSEILFAVIDTGPGIAQEDQPIIFQPFRQTEHGIQHANGTGLGLPISKKLAEAHGGQLWVESELGAGSAFFVSLPLKPVSIIA